MVRPFFLLLCVLSGSALAVPRPIPKHVSHVEAKELTQRPLEVGEVTTFFAPRTMDFMSEGSAHIEHLGIPTLRDEDHAETAVKIVKITMPQGATSAIRVSAGTWTGLWRLRRP